LVSVRCRSLSDKTYAPQCCLWRDCSCADMTLYVPSVITVAERCLFAVYLYYRPRWSKFLGILLPCLREFCTWTRKKNNLTEKLLLRMCVCDDDDMVRDDLGRGWFSTSGSLDRFRVAKRVRCSCIMLERREKISNW
jgi:hypothetical protein